MPPRVCECVTRRAALLHFPESGMPKKLSFIIMSKLKVHIRIPAALSIP